MRTETLRRLWPLALVISFGLAPAVHAATPAELLAAYSAQAGSPPSPERGKKLFTTNFGKALGLSCSSCHTGNPLKPGKDDVTERPITPLAPAANAERFTDKAKVELKFKMNCRDVVGRDCTAAEKADVMSWLLSLNP
jgi:hypothetical protein